MSKNKVVCHDCPYLVLRLYRFQPDADDPIILFPANCKWHLFKCVDAKITNQEKCIPQSLTTLITINRPLL